MCRSLAQGGRRCPDLARYHAMPVTQIAPAHRQDIPDVEWLDDATMDKVWDHGEAAGCNALRILEQLRAEEPQVTDDVMDVAHTAEGWCHGLAFRMKSPHSLARKLDLEFDKAAAVAATTGAGPIDPQKVADQEADDAVRYTICVKDTDQVVPALGTTIDGLREHGWTIDKIKDSYLSDNSYKGLHIIARAPSGRPVEVQIHSQESIDVKDIIHTDYEIARSADVEPDERAAAGDRCVIASRQIRNPAGLDALYPAGIADTDGVTAVFHGANIRKKEYTGGVQGGAS